MLKRINFVLILILFNCKLSCNESKYVELSVEDSLWGKAISSPQFSDDGLDGDTLLTNKLDSNVDASKEKIKANKNKSNSFWGGTSLESKPRHDYLKDYRTSVRRELTLLSVELEKAGYDFDGNSVDSPRETIKAIKDEISRVETVREVIAQNSIIKKWPGEDRAIIGSCIASAHKCFDLTGAFVSNGFAQGILGVGSLAASWFFLKKKT